MVKKILVFNAGSSSLKFALFYGNEMRLFGKCDRIGSSKSHLVINNYEKVVNIQIKNFNIAIKIIKDIIKEEKYEFDVIGHRVVHGGFLKKTSKINSKVENVIKKYSDFAPLHNPNELLVINACKKLRKPQYAVFDTSFFSNLPEKSKVYPIPKEISKKFNIRRYGFHGISHKFVSKGLGGKTVTCHLGNGASVCAIENKNVIDTSMGLTPLEGIMMGTRAGDLDPGLIIFLQKKGYNLDKILNYESGFKAIFGKTDIRDVVSSKSKSAKLALDIFTYKLAKYIGAYAAAMNGLDNLVFTGGIGENIPIVRKKVCDYLLFLGLKIDKVKNNKNLRLISEKRSKVKVYVIKTNEELAIAKEILNEK
ncbi:MAG: acetate/propionate family kinase [archaeon]